MRRFRFLIIILALTLVGFFLYPRGYLNPLKNIFWQVAKPFGVVFNVTFDRPVRFVKSFFSFRSVLKQNSNLIKENLELQSKLAELSEAKHENEILKKELGYLSTGPLYNLLPTTIIGSAPSGYLKTIVLDKGKNNGLVGGEALVSQGYLVGIISNIRESNADAILITDYKSLVPAVLQDSRGTGMLRGGLGGLIVEDIPLNTPIKNGEEVTTSGLGGQIKPGIPIGKVSEIIAKQGEIFQMVRVNSPIDFSRLEVLFILKK